MSAQKTHINVRGLGGTQSMDTMHWINQGIAVQNSRVNVCTVTAVDMRHLKHDMILGLPFLQRLNPKLYWKSGKLVFKGFNWHAHPKTLEHSGVHTLSSAEMEEQFYHPKKFKGKNEETEDLVFVRMMDAIAHKLNGPVSNRKCRGVHFFYNRIYHTKVTSEPHCIS